MSTTDTLKMTDLFRIEDDAWRVTVFQVEDEGKLSVDVQTHDVFNVETTKAFAVAVMQATNFAMQREAEIEQQNAVEFEGMANDIVAQMKKYGVKTVGELVEAKRAVATKEN